MNVYNINMYIGMIPFILHIQLERITDHFHSTNMSIMKQILRVNIKYEIT